MVNLNFIHLDSLLKVQYIEQGRVSSHIQKLPAALQSLSLPAIHDVNYKGVGDKNFPP